MKPILVIFNGIRFPYSLLEYAIKKAKEQQTGLHVLFLTASEGMEEGYVYPNDLSLAETISDEEDEERSNEKLIREHMKAFHDMAAAEGVPFRGERLNNSTLEEILDRARNCSLIFLDDQWDEEPPLLANKNIEIKELIDRAPCPVELVQANKASR